MAFVPAPLLLVVLSASSGGAEGILRGKALVPFWDSDGSSKDRAGGDRQELHEKIRVHAQAAAQQVKGEGKPNDLLERLKADRAFAGVDIEALLAPSAFVGRAPRQVDEFIAAEVAPIRRRYADVLGKGGQLNV